jgi:uncharacterized protein involved in exopolysaccharide biosynthesis
METHTQAPPEGRPRTAPEASVPDRILGTEPILSERELGAYARALVGARWRIIAFVGGAVLAAAALALVLPEKYTAKAVLLPTEEGDQGFPSQLSGIASSFGFALPFGAMSQSDLYPTILTSDRLLRDLLREEFPPKPGQAPVMLAEHLVKRKDLSEEQHLSRAVANARENVLRASKDSETGVVTLMVTLDDADLAAAVGNRLVARLERFLITMRSQEGSKNRTFLDDRLEVVSKDLADAENGLTHVRETNRRVQDSPELLLQQERLHRDLLIQEQIFLELMKQKEIAKIEEVKNTPVLRILDQARPPVRPSHPNKILVVTMGLVLALFAAISYLVIRTALSLAPNLADALRPFGTDLERIRARLPRSLAKRA